RIVGFVNGNGLAMLIQYFQHPFAGANRLLHVGIQVGEASHRTAYERGVQREGKQLPDLQFVMANQYTSVTDNSHDSAEQAEYDERYKYAPVFSAADSDIGHLADVFSVSPGFKSLINKSFDVGYSLQGFLDNGVRLGELILCFPRYFADKPAKNDGNDNKRRYEYQQRDSQLHRNDGHKNDPANEQYRLPHHFGKGSC